METDRFLFWGAIITLLLFGYLALSPADAQEQPSGPYCRPLSVLSNDLETKFHEVQLAGGIASDGRTAVIVFGKLDGSTWTLLQVDIGMTEGRACIIATGEGWFQGNLQSGAPV